MGFAVSTREILPRWADVCAHGECQAWRPGNCGFLIYQMYIGMMCRMRMTINYNNYWLMMGLKLLSFIAWMDPIYGNIATCLKKYGNYGNLIWLLVWNMNFIFHNIWDNPSHLTFICFTGLKPPFGTGILWLSIDWECHHPIWLSYFSEGWVAWNHQPVIFHGI